MKQQSKEEIRAGHVKEPLFINQQVERLGRDGYLESHSDKNWFAVTMEYLWGAHPEARFVEKTGPNAIRQIVYLPKRRREIVSQLRRELKEYEEQVACTRAAIDAALASQNETEGKK